MIKNKIIGIMLVMAISATAQHITRDKGESFVFGVQGDSHPERKGKMFSPELYRVNMSNVASLKPDFYIMMGDDVNLDRFVTRGGATQAEIDRVYEYQNSFTDLLDCPVYPVVGNHDQIAKYLLDGTGNNVAVMSAIAMKRYFPVPEEFSGNTEFVEHVGVLKDYYSFETGNALFVVIDPYWHSDLPVDNVPGDKSKPDAEKRTNRGSDKTKDPGADNKIKQKGNNQGNGNPNKNSWSGTLGRTQYEWLKRTLESSDAKYKFVFAHHVNGSGRGGVECASLFEWGGYGRNGEWEFNRKRPGWDMPIHQLMVKNGVTIFFQGHDHLFCKQQLDGVIYQSVPNPADNTYSAFNSKAYKTGDILPNSGHINVTVSPHGVNVRYIRAFLPGDGENGRVEYSYDID